MFKKKKKSISDITEFQEIEETNGYPIIRCKSGYTYFLNVKGHDLISLKEEDVRLPRPGNGAVVPPRTAELWRAEFEDGAWTVTVDDEGTLRIEDGGSPVLLDDRDRKSVV